MGLLRFGKNIFLFVSIVSFNSYAVDVAKPNPICQSTREFITSLNFLKSNKDLSIEEKKAIEISNEVSGGCNGAANRFIKTLTFLTDAEIPTSEALVISKKIALESDQVFTNFQAIFKKIYIDKYFDLSEKKSLKIATDLTTKMDKEPTKLLEDFNTLGEFCLSRNGVDLGYEKCTDFISTVLINSKNIDTNISKPAIAFFDFLVKDEKGPHLSTLLALKEIESNVEFGVVGINNFSEAFLFANSNSGLNLSSEKAMLFARDMAHKSIKK